MIAEKKNKTAIHSSAAEYLTYVASIGDYADSMEMRYEDENICLTQRMVAQLYDVSLLAINEHIKKIYGDGELIEEATIRKSRIVQTEDWKVSMHVLCLNLSYIMDYVKLEKLFGGIRVKNEKMEMIDNKEFQTLYDKHDFTTFINDTLAVELAVLRHS